jgi:hypothetical protein
MLKKRRYLSASKPKGTEAEAGGTPGPGPEENGGIAPAGSPLVGGGEGSGRMTELGWTC